MDLVELADNVMDKAKDDGGDRLYSTRDSKKSRPAAAAKGRKPVDVDYLEEKLAKLNKKRKQKKKKNKI